MKTMKFLVFSRHDSYSKKLANYLRTMLEQAGWKWDEQNPEFIISVGGDGTLLRAIHQYIHNLDHTLFIAIHTGTLGFFTDYTKDETTELLHDLIGKNYAIWQARLLEAVLLDENGKVLDQIYALNEIRIGNFTSTVSYDVFIDSEFFEHTRGSGLCIATQSGSTAANRSLNGAVVDDGLEVIQLSEIMPVEDRHHHSLRCSYVMHPDRMVVIKGDSLPISTISNDYKEITCPPNVDRILVFLSGKAVRFARYRPCSYLDRLRHLY